MFLPEPMLYVAVACYLPMLLYSLFVYLKFSMTILLRLLISAGVLLSFPAYSAKGSVAPVSLAQCALMKEHNVITDINPVGCNRLATVTFTYVDFDGVLHKDGQVVVLDILGEYVRQLFAELLVYRIPFAMAKPMEHFNGNDEASMEANNTSAFNGRAVTGGHHWSKHAYGVAIDINPVQNPYITKSKGQGHLNVLPPQSETEYMDRSPTRSGMAEEMVSVFYKYGFLIWGGKWREPVDYQHFEIGSIKFINTLIALPPEEGKALFKQHVDSYRKCSAPAINRGRQQRMMIYNACVQQHRK